MSSVSINEVRYNLSRNKLGPEELHWLDYVVGDQLTRAFVAATQTCCLADFHRPTDTADAALYKSDAKLKIDATFVPDGKFFDYSAPLQTDSLVLNLNGEMGMFGGQMTFLESGGARNCCAYAFRAANFNPREANRFLLLLCFQNIDVELAGEIRGRGGLVVLIQDQARAAENPPADPGYFDICVSAETFPKIVKALASLREKYAGIISRVSRD